MNYTTEPVPPAPTLKERLEARRERLKTIFIGVGIGAAATMLVVGRRLTHQMDEIQEDMQTLNQNQMRAADAWDTIGVIHNLKE